MPGNTISIMIPIQSKKVNRQSVGHPAELATYIGNSKCMDLFCETRVVGFSRKNQ